MNLYAICAANAPHNEVDLILAESDDEAMKHGVYAAAKDIAEGNYFSPTAEVYRVAENITKVGDAQAIDAPQEWDWAHPVVDDEASAVATGLKRCELCNDPIEDHIDPAKGCTIWATGFDGKPLTVDK